MNVNVERELKLRAPESFALARLPAELDGFVAAPAHLRRLHTIYYDSDDLRITRWGCSLRYRLDEGWTLKIPVPERSRSLVRKEYVFQGRVDVIPPEVLDLATGYLRGAQPRRIAELRTLRTIRDFRNGSVDVAEVVKDDVHVMDRSRVSKCFSEIEIELNEGADPRVLDAIADVLHRQGAGSPDPVPKNVRAIGDAARVPEIAAPKIGRGSLARDLVQAALVKSVEHLIRGDAKLRLTTDAEAIHQARIAVRRLRSDLRTFLPLLERDWACRLRDELRWLGVALSSARDVDVLVQRVRQDAAKLPDRESCAIDSVLNVFLNARSEAHASVQKMLRDPRYVALLNELVDAAKQPRCNARADELACDVIEPLLRDVWKKARKTVRRSGRPPSDRELHKIRIKSKHLRYAAQAVAPIVGREARRFARKAKRLQDILGDQHDAVVAAKRLREISDRCEVAFIAGELTMVETEAARCGRAVWKSAWRKVARKRSHFWCAGRTSPSYD
ncbi:MAG: CYTH and CHAD domain-containing protein [Vulcanimicrobiaceae bacterium]